jgi:hypothetical protein
MSDIKIKCELKWKKNIGTIKCENENTKRCFIKLKKSIKWRGRRDLYEWGWRIPVSRVEKLRIKR